MGAEGQPKGTKIRFRPGVKRVPEKDRATYVCNLCHKKNIESAGSNLSSSHMVSCFLTFDIAFF